MLANLRYAYAEIMTTEEERERAEDITKTPGVLIATVIAYQRQLSLARRF